MEACWWRTTAGQWVRSREDRERKGSGQSLGPQAALAQARGPATQVPLSPPGPVLSGLAALCAQGSRREGSEPQQTPSAASTSLGAAILCEKGWGKRYVKEGGVTNSWPIGETSTTGNIERSLVSRSAPKHIQCFTEVRRKQIEIPPPWRRGLVN